MEIKILNFKVSVSYQKDIKDLVIKKLQIKKNDVLDFKILHSAIDARKKNDICYNYQFYIKLNKDYSYLIDNKNIISYSPQSEIPYYNWKHPYQPVIIGFGPSGMFSALYLARCNAKPIIIERGSCIEERKKEVNNFFINKILNENSNIQFGEGGAGAFSDGKLTTNLNSPYNFHILNEFYTHGACEDILYNAMPHIGTDYLEKVVHNIREEIISLGGQFYFNTIFTDFQQEKETLIAICNNGLKVKTKHILLCLGHSARDTITHLYHKGIAMEAKPFSMGVRVEHLQKTINKMQYGNFAHYLPNASYKSVVHLKERSVYSFCMCPGGLVMASTSEPNAIVTNGMSEKKRDKTNANAALLVGINTNDFYKNSPLDGFAFQEKYEKAAFKITGNYQAPANLMGEFLHNQIASKHRSVIPSYPHGVAFSDLQSCLPLFVTQSLKEAIPLINKKLHLFFQPDAVLTGVETRSSSPLRIIRGENRTSSINGIFPVGEGAGYAGGIMSAAIDGLKTAIHIVQN